MRCENLCVSSMVSSSALNVDPNCAHFLLIDKENLTHALN